MDDMTQLTGLIKQNISALSERKEQVKKFNEMLADLLENDPVYREHKEQAKEANKLKSKTKNQILKTPQANDLTSRVKALRTEIKDINKMLSGYLTDYAKSGATTFESADGKVLEIVYSAKLVTR